MSNRIRTALLAALYAATASVGQANETYEVSLRRLPPTNVEMTLVEGFPPGGDSDQAAIADRTTDAAILQVDYLDASNLSPPPGTLCLCDIPCRGSCNDAATHKFTGFIDLNYYWDSREFNVMTINAGAKLPYDFSYFQLLNLNGDMGESAARGDWSSFFTEINLRRPIAKDSPYLKHLDFTLQFADGSGPPEVGRLGIRWRMQDTPGPVGDLFRDVLKLRYSITFHLLETDGSGWQIEHVYRRDFLDKRIYMSAFCDHNINDASGSSTWVTEHQMGVRLVDRLYVVGEYRYSSFAPPGLRSGFGLGLEYVIRFKS